MVSRRKANAGPFDPSQPIRRHLYCIASERRAARRSERRHRYVTPHFLERDFWIISQNCEHAVPGNISKAQGMAAHSLCALRNRGASYCDLRFIGLPIATRKMAALPVACGEKKLITSSSKKVSPVAPKP